MWFRPVGRGNRRNWNYEGVVISKISSNWTDLGNSHNLYKDAVNLDSPTLHPTPQLSSITNLIILNTYHHCQPQYIFLQLSPIINQKSNHPHKPQPWNEQLFKNITTIQSQLGRYKNQAFLCFTTPSQLSSDAWHNGHTLKAATDTNDIRYTNIPPPSTACCHCQCQFLWRSFRVERLPRCRGALHQIVV